MEQRRWPTKHSVMEEVIMLQFPINSWVFAFISVGTKVSHFPPILSHSFHVTGQKKLAELGKRVRYKRKQVVQGRSQVGGLSSALSDNGRSCVNHGARVWRQGCSLLGHMSHIGLPGSLLVGFLFWFPLLEGILFLSAEGDSTCLQSFNGDESRDTLCTPPRIGGGKGRTYCKVLGEWTLSCVSW
jgi:hypothetical protein